MQGRQKIYEAPLAIVISDVDLTKPMFAMGVSYIKRLCLLKKYFNSTNAT